MFSKLVLAHKRCFMRWNGFLMMADGQDGRWVRVPWNDLAFEWEYTANKSVDKRGAKQNVDG